MSSRPAFDRLPTSAVAVAAILFMAACAMELRRDEDQTSTVAPAAQDREPLGAQLERCRTVTSEQVTALEKCRRAWSENRSRFLGQKSNQSSNRGGETEQQSAPPSIKDQSRLPQSHPPIAPLESE